MGAGAINWADVKNHASDLADVPPAVQADFLAYVNTQVNTAKLGGETAIKTRLARIYLAAHFGTLWARENSASSGATDGEVASETISGSSLSITYAQAMTAEVLATTKAGRSYRGFTVGARVPIIPGC